MPHTRSAEKNLRKTEKRRLYNRSVKKAIKKQLKQFQDVAESGTLEELRKEYNLCAKRLDKAAARRVVHPNLAARKKSQLARAIREKTPAPAPATT